MADTAPPRSETDQLAPQRRPHYLLDALIRPTSLLVLGASAQRSASANQALENLRHAGYRGSIHVVHPTATEVDGYPTVSAINQAPRGIDLALVSLPAPAVCDALEELETRQCRAAIVPAVGLTEADHLRFAALRERGTMAIHGPNTMGLLNVVDRIPLAFWVGTLTEVKPGSIALIAQSGGACLGVARGVEHAGFSRILPTGNEWGVTAADYLAWLAQDDATSDIGVIVESLVDVDAFTASVAKLRDAGKRLAVLHVGRTARGRAAAQAHTAALLGRREIYEAYFEELDVPLTADYDELATILDAYSHPRLPRPRGGKVAAITVSGGLAALTADIAERVDVSLAELDVTTQHDLQELLPGSTPANPFDTGGGASYTAERFQQALRILASDPNVDSVMAVLEAHQTLTDSEVAYEQEDFDATREAAQQTTDVPIVIASSSSGSTHSHWREVLGDTVPLLRGVGNALTALKSLGMNRRQVTSQRAHIPPRNEELLATARLEISASDGVTAGLTRRLLDAYGIPRADSTPLSSSDNLDDLHAVRYPAVVKVSSPDIPHRSDVGGVITDVSNPAQLLEAVHAIRTRVLQTSPNARIVGFEVQEQLTAALEAIVGFATDPVFGPIVVVGTGGTLVELQTDHAFARAPLSIERAEALIDRTRLALLAAGYRNQQPETDLRPLAQVVVAVSELAVDCQDLLSEGELNPVMVEARTGRVTAVDWLLVPRRPTPQPTHKAKP